MTRRRIIAFAALVGTAAAVVVPAAAVPAQAISFCKPDNQCVYTYYSTSSYTTQVGDTYIFCNGTSSTVGEVTGYVRFWEGMCD